MTDTGEELTLGFDEEFLGGDGGEIVAVELPHTIELVDPFTVGDGDGERTVKQLTFKQRFRIEFLRDVAVDKFGEISIDEMAHAIAGMCEVDVDTVLEMGGADFIEAFTVAAGLMKIGVGNVDELSAPESMPYVLPLVEPITVGKREHDQLVFKHRFKVAQVRKLRLSNIDSMTPGECFVALQSMCNLPSVVIERLGMIDFIRAYVVFKGFFMRGLRTGKKRSG